MLNDNLTGASMHSSRACTAFYGMHGRVYARQNPHVSMRTYVEPHRLSRKLAFDCEAGAVKPVRQILTHHAAESGAAQSSIVAKRLSVRSWHRRHDVDGRHLLPVNNRFFSHPQ